MGSKYMALCSSYPYPGYSEHSISVDHLLPFLIKLHKAKRKYPIIDITYRNFRRMK